LVGKPEGKRSHGIPRGIWEDNIRTDLMELRWTGVDWIHLAQDKEQRQTLAKTVMNLRIP
jgi:hypothetical protein